MTGDEILLSMKAATKAIDAHLARFGKPMRELRIRPDDYEELKREAQPFLTHSALGATDSFSGVRLIQDETAEPLPRKTNP